MNMRNVMLVMVALLGALSALSCKRVDGEPASGDQGVVPTTSDADDPVNKLKPSEATIYLWIDPVTKCHYLKIGDFLAPRMSGKVVGHQVCE